MPQTPKANIADVPIELFLSYILLQLPLVDLLSLTCCSKAFVQTCSVESFWRSKVEADLGISPDRFSRRGCTWKRVYERLLRPQLYVWGCVSVTFCDQWFHRLPFQKFGVLRTSGNARIPPGLRRRNSETNTSPGSYQTYRSAHGWRMVSMHHLRLIILL